HFASAAGSSTESVVEYMLASLYQLQQSKLLSFAQDKLGIIGVGRIGGLLDQACQKMGLQTLRNDPPRQRQQGSHSFHDLRDVLQHADILTLHTPLINEGEDRTNHLIDADCLAKFKGRGIINAGRGQCIDNTALLAWLNRDASRFAVLDCWEHEPNINLALLNHGQVKVATPHIAGHSLDGKAANTFFVYRELCDFLNIPQDWDMHAALPPIEGFSIEKDSSKEQLVSLFYPIQQETLALKEAAQQGDFPAWFQTYRRNYPVRRSWKKQLKHSGNKQEDMFF
ncbi:MAG: NAD(P)-dependent oxidoreductase, partial [Ghiorsea sp.]